VAGSFLAWSLVFGIGSYLIGRQLGKIVGSNGIVDPVLAFGIGLAALILMVGIHFLRSKVFRDVPKYSFKFLAVPLVLLALEGVIFWVFRL